MKKNRISALSSMVVVATLAVTPAAMAASAHNLQTGAHTANPNDTSEDAAVKQDKQEQQATSRAPWASLR